MNPASQASCKACIRLWWLLLCPYIHPWQDPKWCSLLPEKERRLIEQRKTYVYTNISYIKEIKLNYNTVVYSSLLEIKTKESKKQRNAWTWWKTKFKKKGKKNFSYQSLMLINIPPTFKILCTKKKKNIIEFQFESSLDFLVSIVVLVKEKLIY